MKVDVQEYSCVFIHVLCTIIHTAFREFCINYLCNDCPEFPRSSRYSVDGGTVSSRKGFCWYHKRGCIRTKVQEHIEDAVQGRKCLVGRCFRIQDGYRPKVSSIMQTETGNYALTHNHEYDG